MPTVFSSLLRSVNRKNNDKLNILLANYNEQFQSNLSNCNHNFYIMTLPNTPSWNTTIREIPSNCHMLQGSIQDQISIGLGIDLVISQDRHFQYPTLSQIAKQMSCPIISIDNNIPYIDMNQFYVRNLADQKYNQSIFCSKFVSESWGFDCQTDIVPKCIDTELFKNYNGGDGKILTIVDGYEQRQKISGFNIWQKLRNKFKMNPHGNSPGLSNTILNLDKRLSLYKECSIFLNTTSWSSTPFELLEAMSCGCPVITTNITDHTDFIQNGKNGFITNNYEEIENNVKFLLDNKDKAKEIGANARETMVKLNNINVFKEAMNNILYSNIDKISATFLD
jgi:hypothetical protein